MSDYPKLTKEELFAIASNICPDCRNTGFFTGPRDGLCIDIKCTHPLCGSAFNISGYGTEFFAERISHPSPEKTPTSTAMNPKANNEQKAFKEWALVELFGHQKIVGEVTETTLAGGAFLRVDVPEFNGAAAFTRFYSPGAIYSINPISEAVARGLMERYRNEPISRFELPMLAEKVAEDDDMNEY